MLKRGEYRVVLPFAFLALVLTPASAAPSSPQQRALFVQKHPCPANGKTAGLCPGYVITHVVPLCSGGKDVHTNLRWQPVAETLASAQEAHQLCHRAKAKQ